LEISREAFWNIQYGRPVYLGMLLLLPICYSIYRRYRLWSLGKPVEKLEKGRLGSFITGAAKILIHKRLLGIGSIPSSPKELYAGIMHALIFAGMLLLLLVTLLLAVHEDFVPFMHGVPYLIISFLGELGGIFAFAGLVMAVIRRYIRKPERLDNTLDDSLTLVLLLLLIITGFVIEGLRISATIPAPPWERWSFVGFALAEIFGLEKVSLLRWHKWIWWLHVGIFYGTVIYLCFSFPKLFHIIVSPINIFFCSLRPKGALAPIANIEDAETFGASDIDDFTWKQLLDLDACTNCGRCQDSCPAYISGKTLSPKRVIRDMKVRMEERGSKQSVKSPALAGEIIKDDDIWSCTTCRSCQEVCPVFVEHVDKIVEMRRNLTMTQSRMPEAVQLMVGNLFSRGHPWTGAQYMRLKGDWMDGLELNILGKEKNIDTLLWVGCTGALADRNADVTRSLVKILQSAGVDFTVMGAEEPCCGDPARRIGFEILFAEQVQQNIEIFHKHNVKRIITACPHCFNTIKNEYRQFGGDFEVLHHSQLLARLLRDGKLKITGGERRRRVTYHDSCYLGRYNDIYYEPRDILSHLPRIETVEMPRFGQRALCCGGGGGRIWMEEPVGTKINRIRTEEAFKTGSEVVVTACPFCLQMFDEGIRAKELDKDLKVMDLVELVETSMAVSGEEIQKRRETG